MSYKEFIELAEKKGITNIQITIETNINNEIYYINNILEDYSDISKTIYNIKAEYNGKVEYVYTEYLEESIIDLIIEKITLTDTKYEDEFLQPKKIKGITHDKKISVNEISKKIKELLELNQKYPLIKAHEFAYSDDYEETQIVNNKGLDITTSSHTYSFIVEATAQNNDESASYSRKVLSTNKEAIDFENIVIEVLDMATKQALKERLETKRYDIILDSSVVNSVLSTLKNMLSAQSIRKKTSCLTDKLNNKLFSDKLTIIEEPLNEKYPGYTIFDKEGTDTNNKVIIEKGVLKTYLYDIKEAKLKGINSTGNNYGQIGTRNMYIKPSNNNLEQLFSKMKDGIYITDKMGASGTSMNENTGNISIQVFGYIVKDGKIASGFHPAIMSTTIFELLSNIEEIGNDLIFQRKDIGSPSLYIKNISIAAE